MDVCDWSADVCSSDLRILRPTGEYIHHTNHVCTPAHTRERERTKEKKKERKRKKRKTEKIERATAAYSTHFQPKLITSTCKSISPK